MPVPQSFLGFSFEYPDVLRYTGASYFGANGAFEGLMRQLAAFGGGLPQLRVGGGTADASWWNPDGRPKPPGIDHDIGPFWVAGVRQFVADTGAPLMLTLNLVQPDPRFALDWALAATAAFGRQVIYELGNEPELYGVALTSIDQMGVKHHAPPRRRPWSFSRYLSEFSAKARLLRQAIPNVRLAGPAVSSFDWSRMIARYLRRNGRLLSVVTLHGYPLCTCIKNRAKPQFPSLAHLLGPKSVGDLATDFRPTLRTSRRRHLPFRITETNSIAGGGGKLGPSFASALWGSDWMFLLAEAGVEGVNFHTSGTYTPVAAGFSGGRFFANVLPLYYAMLLFARATADHARFLPDATFVLPRGRGANITPWATSDAHGNVRVVIVNKELKRGGFVDVRVPRGAALGSLIRLRAPSATASTGVTLAGQSFAVPTYDGQLQGAPGEEHVSRRRGSVYRFFVPKASAAMLTVSTPARLR